MKICDGSAARWILAALVFSTLCQPVHAIDEEAEWEYREQHGAANVIWMNGLMEDYWKGRLPESTLLRQLWVERPYIMSIFYAEHNGDFNFCFQLHLIAAESNGVKFEANGTRVFYDTELFLDENREVIPGYERDYNDAVRANAILNDVYNLNPNVCQSNPPNNMCCTDLLGDAECKKATGRYCNPPQGAKTCPNGQLCVGGG